MKGLKSWKCLWGSKCEFKTLCAQNHHIEKMEAKTL